MATIKSYTDLEQSKMLAEILPLDSADMFYTSLNSDYPWVWIDKHLMEVDDIPCWSLAALLSVLPLFSKVIAAFTLKTSVPILRKTTECYVLYYNGDYKMIEKKGENIEVPFETRADNPVDACVEMIIKLHELKML